MDERFFTTKGHIHATYNLALLQQCSVFVFLLLSSLVYFESPIDADFWTSELNLLILIMIVKYNNLAQDSPECFRAKRVGLMTALKNQITAML